MFDIRADVPVRTYVDDFIVVVPEPGTAALLLGGLIDLALRRHG